MIQCLAFGEGYVDYFDEGTVELATCGISEATNAVIAPGPQESRGDLPAQVVDSVSYTHLTLPTILRV